MRPYDSSYYRPSRHSVSVDIGVTHHVSNRLLNKACLSCSKTSFSPARLSRRSLNIGLVDKMRLRISTNMGTSSSSVSLSATQNSENTFLESSYWHMMNMIWFIESIWIYCLSCVKFYKSFLIILPRNSSCILDMRHNNLKIFWVSLVS